jgi:hypothetical protein
MHKIGTFRQSAIYPYRPVLVQSDYYQFRFLKKFVSEKRFSSNNERKVVISVP